MQSGIEQFAYSTVCKICVLVFSTITAYSAAFISSAHAAVVCIAACYFAFVFIISAHAAGI